MRTPARFQHPGTIFDCALLSTKQGDQEDESTKEGRRVTGTQDVSVLWGCHGNKVSHELFLGDMVSATIRSDSGL